MDKTFKLFCMLSMVLLVLPSAAAQNGFPIDEIKLSLGESKNFEINLRNPLTIYDNYTLSFKGRATTDGYVKLNISSEETEVRGVNQLSDCGVDEDCCTGELECVFRMGPGTRKNITYTATATLAGQEEQAELKVEALSDQTQLTGSDTITISTRPINQQGTVSAPGMTTPFLFVLGILSTGFYMFYKS